MHWFIIDVAEQMNVDIQINALLSAEELMDLVFEESDFSIIDFLNNSNYDSSLV